MDDHRHRDEGGSHGIFAFIVILALGLCYGLGWLLAYVSSLLTPNRHHRAGSEWPIYDL